MTPNRNHKIYFPNLNGLRFIAAVFVIINHIEQLKRFYRTADTDIPQFAKIIGKLGVMLFFVLSGFLITYLLLSEEFKTGKIHSKKFYTRRFLRIAPLYFLIIAIVFFVLQHFTFWDIPGFKNPVAKYFYTTLGLHIIFLPNLATAIYGFLPYIAQAWSIGTEEQSYLLWPILLKRFKKNRLKLMIGIIAFYLGVRLLLKLLLNFGFNTEIIEIFWRHFNIDSIAIGGVFAVLLFTKHRMLKHIVNLKVFYPAVIITILMLFIGVIIPYFQYLSYSILFGIIILNLAANEALKKSFLEWKLVSYLGKISYGIYMYHFIVMIAALVWTNKIGVQTNWSIYSLTILGSITISMISYHYFESIFLKLKTRFTLVKSGGSEF